MADELHDPSAGLLEKPVRSVGEVERTALVRALAAEHPVALDDWLAANVLDIHTVVWLNQQGLGPFTYHRLRGTGLGDRVATDTMTVLRAGYLHTVADNTLILDGALTWAARFGEADIPAVWIKGVPLSNTVYPHPGLRPMSDIDVVVRRSDRGQALALVEKLTGQHAGTLPEHSGMHACFDIGRQNRVKMEVHWSLLDIPDSGIAADTEWFLEQRQVIKVGSVSLLTLRPEAHLLYLCAHAEIAHGEGQMRLLRYLDLHLLLRHVHALDWSLIIERAVCFGWTYAIERALTISQHYFDTPLPEGLLSELQQRRPANEDIGNVTRRQAPGNRWELTLRRLETMAWPVRLRLAFQLAFPPVAYVRWRYRVDRSWKLPFFYLFRWSDVFNEALKTVSKQVRQRDRQDRVHDD